MDNRAVLAYPHNINRLHTNTKERFSIFSRWTRLKHNLLILKIKGNPVSQNNYGFKSYIVEKNVSYSFLYYIHFTFLYS